MTSPKQPILRQPEIAWLVGGLWWLAFLIMTGAEITFGYEGFSVGLTRSIIMALVGAALSSLLWRWLITASWPLPTRILLLGLGIVAAVAMHTLMDFALTNLVREAFGEADPGRRIVSNDPVRGAIMLLIAESGVLLFAALHAFFGIAAVAVRSATETRERDRLLAEARATSAGAQLAALRHQLSPHFLFNALNAIGSLVETARPYEASSMIDRLSGFLRSSLSGDGADFVTLEEELATVESYLDIEAVRFGSRLQVRYDCPAGLRPALVPSFILQPLVENAIKHAVAPAMRPVTIELSAQADGEDLLLSIEDSGPDEGADLTVKPRSAGVGLKNIRERLHILYGARGTLEAGPQSRGFIAVARLPLTLAGG